MLIMLLHSSQNWPAFYYIKQSRKAHMRDICEFGQHKNPGLFCPHTPCLASRPATHNLASTRENLSSGICEQHRRRPACAPAFVIRLLKSIISRLATGEISIFLLVFVPEQAGLNLTLSETARRGPINWGNAPILSHLQDSGLLLTMLVLEVLNSRWNGPSEKNLSQHWKSICMGLYLSLRHFCH